MSRNRPRIENWKDLRYGMFNEGIPVEEYRELKERFTAEKMRVDFWGITMYNNMRNLRQEKNQ